MASSSSAASTSAAGPSAGGGGNPYRFLSDDYGYYITQQELADLHYNGDLKELQKQMRINRTGVLQTHHLEEGKHGKIT